jgi:hypothetical protein
MAKPIERLALTLRAAPGAYCLLLGSGVSRSANILTGYEVMVDLVTQLAIAAGDGDREPLEWYEHSHGQSPRYDEVLSEVARAGLNRREILSRYFEPSEDDTGAGRKVAQAGHQAIARLVLAGNIRVILTTNFDPLLEKALMAVGVDPIVITKASDVGGAPPLVHPRCTIVKVNGDYRDERIRNTPEELAWYEPEIEDIVRRIFCDFGIVACGWSVTSDSRLAELLRAELPSRFETFIVDVNDPDNIVGQLEVPDGTIVSTVQQSSDDFFTNLEAIMDGLSQPASEYLSAQAAVSELQRYLEGPFKSDLRVANLIGKEGERVYAGLSRSRDPNGSLVMPGGFEELIDDYSELTRSVASVALVASHFTAKFDDNIVRAVERVAAAEFRNSNSLIHVAGLHSAALLLYACGYSAVSTGRYELLRAVANVDVRVDARRLPLVIATYVNAAGLDDKMRFHMGDRGGSYALSRHLRAIVSDLAGRFLFQAAQTDQVLDRLEYVLGLIHTDIYERMGHNPWGPPAAFSRRVSPLVGEPTIQREVRNDIQAMGPGQPLVASGLFSSADRLEIVQSNYQAIVNAAFGVG